MQCSIREVAHCGRVCAFRGGVTLFLLFVALSGYGPNARSAEDCALAVARVDSVEGAVQVRRTHDAAWRNAKPRSALCAGDQVRVGARSRAGLVLLGNETTLRLDQNSTLTLDGEGQRSGSLLDLLSGALHVITRTPQPFKVKTPFVNAAIEGTEFLVEADSDKARVAVFQGQVSASNPFGILSLVAGEIALATKDQVPRKQVMVRPVDAVQWALYYPNVIDYRLAETKHGSAAEPALREAIDLYRQGRLAEAIFRTDKAPEGLDDPRFLSYRAGLLLMVGRADEAKPVIEHALAVDPHYSDALALKAVIAVVQNDPELAFAEATKAVELGPSSPAPYMAISYAQQARFKIDEARASVRKALELEQKSALAWARLAELQMSIGELDSALESAQRAVTLDPGVAKTQSVLGFANLTRLDTKAAKQAFGKAIELDQAEPLSRLGLGLAKIREGDLNAGREEIEIAVSLDPGNSLIRSYMGKAYAEEGRGKLAGAQFDLAKKFDPRDPTPWYYAALADQSNGRPVEVLQSLEKSVQLNDNRAVYRSRLLLDQDRAARAAHASRAYLVLGLTDLARIEAAESVASDPSNYSGHRLLADALARLPDQQSTSISELLQAQLLQPVSLSPVRPSQLVPEFSLPQSAGLLMAGHNEYSPLFESGRPRLTLSALAGDRNTLSDELTLSGVAGGLSYSLGQFRYESDGFRANDDVRHQVYNAFAQYTFSPELSVQAELRSRETFSGDLTLTSNPKLNNYTSVDRWRTDKDSARFGLRYSPSPANTMLVSVQRAVRNDQLLDGVFSSGLRTQQVDKQYATRAEVQFQHQGDGLNLVGGLDALRTFGPTSVAVLLGQTWRDVLSIRSSARQRTAYLYGNLTPDPRLVVTLGVSNTHRQVLQGASEATREHWDPKLGLIWKPAAGLRLRAAAFRAVRPTLTVEDRLEPSQLAGFSQNIDGVPGSVSEFGGVGIDYTPNSELHFGIEGSRRWTSFDVRDARTGAVSQEEAPGKAVSAFAGWMPSPRWALTLKAERNLTSLPGFQSSVAPIALAQTVVPLELRHFGDGFFAMVGLSAVRQTVRRSPGAPNGDPRERFLMLDAQVGIPLPNRWGVVSIEGRNLLNDEFTYLYSPLLPDTETRLLRDARFAALGRQILLRVNLAF